MNLRPGFLGCKGSAAEVGVKMTDFGHSYGPSSSQHGARERQVSGYGASSAAVPMPGSEISGSRGRYDRGPRASL